MKVFAAAAILVIALGAAGTAEAKGCIKGALVGGIAGKMAGHGVLGAAAGCAVGRHRANQRSQAYAPAQR